MSFLLFRGEGEAGGGFREVFREIFLRFLEAFGEVSQAVSIEKIWEEEGGKGGEDVVE